MQDPGNHEKDHVDACASENSSAEHLGEHLGGSTSTRKVNA